VLRGVLPYAAACLLAGSDVKLSTVAAEIGIVRAVAMARGDDSARENQLPSAGTFFDVLCPSEQLTGEETERVERETLTS
jgi:hypothetical protein